MVRIEVAFKNSDTRGEKKKKKLSSLGFDIDALKLVDLYQINANLSLEQLVNTAGMIHNPVIHDYCIDKELSPKNYEWKLEIGFLPKVTDSSANTLREMIGDSIRELKSDESISTSQVLYLSGNISQENIKNIASSLINPLIQGVKISKFKEEIKQENFKYINLDIPDVELLKLAKFGILDHVKNDIEIRRGPLALNLEELKAIRTYFKNIRPNSSFNKPTDVELECLAQTWSEHCKHKIFSAEIQHGNENIDGLFKTFIQGATKKINHKSAISVFHDNAGAFEFDKRHLIWVKVETHNHPSSIDPYGGAGTGIGGVIRDIMGSGKAAKPILNFFGYCLPSVFDKNVFYRAKNKKNPLLTSRQLLDGIVEGVRDYGNEIGVPTVNGYALFDKSFRGKPLVVVGSAGISRKFYLGDPHHEKKARPDDLIVMIGGRVGKDGIHGATSSSESLSETSPCSSVQIGDPITEKKCLDALLEARDKGLYTSITDNGAGGLSCSVFEMAKESGGATVYLDKVPLKYEGLSPWEILVSESQERMTLSVSEHHIKGFETVMKKHGVESTVIGKFESNPYCAVFAGGEMVLYMATDFLHDGCPKLELKTETNIKLYSSPKWNSKDDFTDELLNLISSENISSIEHIFRQYDHEVQGGSVIKPILGRGNLVTNSSVTKPLLDSNKGLALSIALHPRFGLIDSWDMAKASVDEVIRNLICAGANPNQLALLDNFCWASSNDPKQLWHLVRACKGLYHSALAYGAPLISGKDSMFNDFKGYTADNEEVKISALRTLQISGIGIVDNVEKCISPEFKFDGDLIYLLGTTAQELGGSEYYHSLGFIGNTVPKTFQNKNFQIYKKLASAIDEEILVSAMPIAKGGLAIALAKACIGGQVGAKVSLDNFALSRSPTTEGILFSESTGRILCTIAPDNKERFEYAMQGFVFKNIGKVSSNDTLQISRSNYRNKDEQKTFIDAKLKDITDNYKKTFEGF